MYSDKEKIRYAIAQNQSFAQIKIGSKIELYEYSPTLEILLFLAITPISAYYYNNKLYV